MSRAKGTFKTLDTWAAELAPGLPGSAGWVLLELSYQSNYDEKGLTVPQLMDRLKKKDPRTIEQALKYLIDQGHALPCPQSLQFFAQGCAQDLAQALRRGLPQKWAKKHGLDSKQVVSYPWIKSPREVREGIEGSKSQARGTEAQTLTEPDLGLAPASTPEPQTAPRADARTADAVSPERPTPVQVKNEVQATPETKAAQVVELGGAAAPQAGPDALRLFMGLFMNHLDGQHFCVKYADRLDPWRRAYSDEFITLAWELAPTVPGVRRRYQALAWLLDEEREWPEALRLKYVQDAENKHKPATDPRSRVQAGDLLRWANGTTATVQRVDSAFAVTDAEDDRLAYVPLAQLGQSVEVLRS